MTSATAQKVIDHVHAHRERYLNGYKELLGIPSVSTDPTYKEELERCADWVIAEMQRIGLKNCRRMATDGHPVVYGEWLEAGADKPTLLIYAHYDVQPVDPLNLWETPPFEPSIRDGKLYARGAVDDKSGVWGNLKAMESMFAVEGKLPVNVKVLFEGEEESGSPNMLPFVVANKELLKADLLVLCDGGFESQQPKIGSGGRGIVGAEVIITGPDHDLHSGMYGGVVHNPAHLVGKIVGSFHDDSGRIQIPGYYDRVRKLSDAELQSMKAVWDIIGDEYRAGAGVKKFWGESIASFPERVTALPTLEVNGIWGGYQGPGIKTVLPSKAGFKATMRLVDNQNPQEIAQMFKDYVLSFAPETLDVQVNVLTTGWPFTALYEGPVIDALQEAFEATTGKRALMERSGGSIPIAGMFQKEMDIPMIGMGLGAGENIHSPNEYLRLDDFFLGIDTLIHFYYNVADKLK